MIKIWKSPNRQYSSSTNVTSMGKRVKWPKVTLSHKKENQGQRPQTEMVMSSTLSIAGFFDNQRLSSLSQHASALGVFTWSVDISNRVTEGQNRQICLCGTVQVLDYRVSARNYEISLPSPQDCWSVKLPNRTFFVSNPERNLKSCRRCFSIFVV